jgi:hypothetical protein
MSLNEVIIQKPLVQIVLKSKHNLYHDGKKHLGQNVLMATNVVGTVFLKSFVARTVRARENAGFTQEEMCGILHISQGPVQALREEIAITARAYSNFLHRNQGFRWLVVYRQGSQGGKASKAVAIARALIIHTT